MPGNPHGTIILILDIGVYRGPTNLFTVHGICHLLFPPSSRFEENQVVGFLLGPDFLHGLSAACHLGLLFVLFTVWPCTSCRQRRPKKCLESGRFRLYRPALLSCLGLALFYLFVCVFNYFWFVHEQWSHGMLAAQVDLAVRAVAWSGASAYLHFEFRHWDGKKFPGFLRTWWCLYSLLVLDFVQCGKLQVAPIHLWVADVGSAIFGLFLCYAGLSGVRVEKYESSREPLLNHGESVLSKSNDGEQVSMFSNAGLLSVLTFSWMGPLFSVGYRKTLDLDDVPQLADNDSVNGFFPIFKEKLESYANIHGCSGGSRPGSSGTSSTSTTTTSSGDSTDKGGIRTLLVVKALVFSTWRLILWTAVCALVNTLSSYVGPWLVDSFVHYLNGRQRMANEGFLLVTAFVVAKIFYGLSQRYWFFSLQRAAIRVREALVAIIYQKGLALSSNSRQGRTSGEVINLMSIDADRIGLFSCYMHDLWMVPIHIGLTLLLIYSNLGVASLAALAAMAVVILANVPLGRMQEKYQEKLMASKDVRMKAMLEILGNMRILKLQAWEMKFLSKILDLRKQETNWLKKYIYTSVMMTLVFWGAPTFVSVVTFGSCMLMGVPLESGKVLSALATFRILQESIYSLPETISMFIQSKVSLDRISSFLQLEELLPDVVEKLPSGSLNAAVEVKNGTFSWEPSAENPTLNDLNFQILHGMRVAICGTVGSGKSTLLSCILGEVPKISGNIRLCGSTAYVSQAPWIQSGKIEDNVLFGKEMDRLKYESVLEACCLKKDLKILPFGDQTIIGERGINLSGGQKQRIQIARALYHDADIFLFDDPFSAVDAHTGNHLFKECLLRMLSSKTVIYVTHQVDFLPSADLILVMKHGRITQAGKYNEILSTGTDFIELFGAHMDALSAIETVNLSPEITGRTMVNVETHKEDTNDKQNGKSDNITGHSGHLVQEEEREKGKVGFLVYWRYITTAYKGALVPFILLAQILFEALQIGSNYWMAWASPESKDMKPLVSPLVFVSVYVALALGSFICIIVRALLLATAGYKTATSLFNKMHNCIFHAPMSFFDSTPSGRILNRASTDQSEVDRLIANQIGAFTFSLIQLLGIIAVMSQVAWQVFIVFIPVIGISCWYQQYYLATARELARLVGACKAPIIQHFSESLSGSMTIMSFNEESRFVCTNFHLNDAYSRPKFHNAAAMEWLCLHLDMLGIIAFAFSLVFLVSLPKGTIDPAIAGVAVTYGLHLNMLQMWINWNLCNLENKIISVERILQYTCIPSEPPLTIETNKPNYSWPSQGEVDIHDLQVRYAPHMPFVLRGLTCTFAGGMKTGIVGRTGSGKSTLIQALFRIVDPTVGRIVIDGTDIKTVGLHNLRSKLSIIPQDPTMFEGTVRGNLDPLDEYTDDQIWQALDTCQLGDEVERKGGKLDSLVTKNGENWSVGQRQLVCLGRVVLKKSKILVLDEATASVDTATDNLIQKTLRQQFSDSTVITIAHRITSVLDSDMVLLLDNGIIAEYDSPSRLLENKSSLFSKLVSEYTLRSSSSFERLEKLELPGFLLQPVFLHGLSASVHVCIMLILLTAWSWRRYRVVACKERCPESSRFPLRNPAFFACLCLSLFDIFLCVFHYFWSMHGGWSDDKIASQLDLAARALTWSLSAAYLSWNPLVIHGKKFTAFFQTWWALFLLISCSFLVINLLFRKSAGFLPAHLWALDIGSVLLSILLTYIGFFGRRLGEGESSHLRVPLLNQDRVNASASLLWNASLLSVLTFSWVWPLLSAGYRKRLDLDDVPQLADDDSAHVFLPLFKSKLEEYTGSGAGNGGGGDSNGGEGIRTFHLGRALVASAWREILWTALCDLISTLCSYAGPWLIRSFVEYLNGRRRFAHEGLLLVIAFAASKLVDSLSLRHWVFMLQRVQIRVRAALASTIYEKGLHLSNSSRQASPTGEVINLISVDANKVGWFFWRMHNLWLIPLDLTLAFLILYSNLGLASLTAFAATVAVMFGNIPLGKMIEKYQEKMMASKDERTKATTEILKNMRILKFQAWEMKFLSKITKLRMTETSWLRKLIYASSTVEFFFWIAPTFVSVVTFGTCILMAIPLEAGKVLSALATFKLLQVPIYNLPDTISTVVQAKVSLDRISSFLQLEELQPGLVERLPRDHAEVAIEVKDGTFSWDPSSENAALKDLNFQVRHGMRVAVCGTVGSGKSSLLSCILGEVSKLSGSVKVYGRMAYVPQSPWIQSGKIVDNILFGKAMDRDKYEHVLEACALTKDLAVLPFGDNTIIGERGINLSGGQKQRIQIARALYHDADIFLFDDPFSAVDAHTGTHIFKVMKKGRITEAGRYNDILKPGTDFMELVGAHKRALLSHDSMHLMPQISTMDDVRSNHERRLKEEKNDEENAKNGSVIVGQSQQLVQEEEREEGRVGFPIYWRYMTAVYKGALVPLILLSQVLLQALQVGSNYWMAWAAPISTDTAPPVSGLVLICVYMALALGSSVCTLATTLLLATAGYKTAMLLFNQMHMCIFRAPMSFFDSTPTGRILKRVTSDQSDVDTSVYDKIGAIFFWAIQLIGVVVVMSQVAWQVFIVFVPVIAACIWYQQYYIATARELARLIGLSGAPVIQHCSESLSGSVTIRSFEQEPRFLDTNLHLCDSYSRPMFHGGAAMAWLCFRLEMLTSVVFALSVAILVFLPGGALDPAMAGLAVTYGLSLDTIQNILILNLCSLETEIVSVERILQYTSIPSEPPLTVDVNKPGSNWPSKGEVDIRDLQVRYAPHLPFVLRGLTCTFHGGMKTGIVGRTGSGKSTLIQTLFRIVDPTVGRILIDGTDISTIGLHDLRTRLSIIPQEPTMFEGTVRSNLDPLGEYTDEDIWQALDKCQLGEVVRSKEGKLDAAVNEDGENWSMGQRQLVCLGRVILKKSRILVLDEATASVDTATDNLIQKTVRKLFSDSTVITVAHRITSVLDSDMVLLLDSGVIAECGSPSELLENKSSAFSKLVSEYTMR
ncbi:hypothetical protein Taro_029058 [Colocasia esculenta]|uniref:ABC transporter C family member 3 n=1 Tax=Colocasia esculenta TaxID=4460 RepID=A0A843VTR4_COLES|nr:hypothetical protein [Colocasia esculenta]